MPISADLFSVFCGKSFCQEINRQIQAGQKALTCTIMKQLKALLINPYIYDFAAYNFWSSPLGLLYVGSILRKNGFEIGLIDCMKVQEEKRKEDGRAPFFKEKVTKPAALKGHQKKLQAVWHFAAGINKATFRGGETGPYSCYIYHDILVSWHRRSCRNSERSLSQRQKLL